MEQVYGAYYPSDDIGERKLPDNTDYLRGHNILRVASPEAGRHAACFKARLDAGETLYLLGLLGTAHNSGVSLIKASRAHGIEIVINCEEERFNGTKHFAGYPHNSVATVKDHLARRGLAGKDIFGVFYAFDVVDEEQHGLRMLLTNSKIIKGYHFKSYLDAIKPTVQFGEDEERQFKRNMFSHSPALVSVFKKLSLDLGLPAETPCILMHHHESHASLAYSISPFARAAGPTMVACVDGGGDLASSSIFVAEGSRLDLVRRTTRANSLEMFYMLCAIVLGGWTSLNVDGEARSDNRFMTAAAYGNLDRMTNPFYRRLRQYFHFGPQGSFYANATMAEDSMAGVERIVGSFYFVDGERNAVPTIEQARELPLTQERVDVAAAVQLIFEDVLFHVVGALIAETGADRLVLCGQAAVNLAANLRLVEHFGERYFRHYGLDGECLHLWVPPTPSDQGAIAGAPYRFALLNGAVPSPRGMSPFLCGQSPTGEEIAQQLEADRDVEILPLGPADDAALGRWLARLVADGSAVGLFRGAAENGARALGHRSILADPSRKDTADLINSRIKRREYIRPLSLVMSLEEAQNWFALPAGAAAGDFDAYRYLIMAARAKPEAAERFPGAILPDGTGRIQVVREKDDLLLWSYLAEMKRLTGAAASVNTSLNVGTPIAQTPRQALQIFTRAPELEAIIFVGSEGQALMAWPKTRVGRRDLAASFRAFLNATGDGAFAPETKPGRGESARRVSRQPELLGS